jgi:hypothetical protein
MWRKYVCGFAWVLLLSREFTKASRVEKLVVKIKNDLPTVKPAYNGTSRDQNFSPLQGSSFSYRYLKF